MHRPARTTDKLGFSVWCSLVVHSPYGSSTKIEGNAALCKMRIKTARAKLFLTPRAGEVTALIHVSLLYQRFVFRAVREEGS